MSTDKGYIKIYRDIRDHWVWEVKPYDKARAWIDLIMIANHEKKTILFDGRLMTIERGQHMTSLKTLAARWGWTRSKVKRFLDVLKSEQMIDTKRNRNGTLITIVNYGIYQDSRNTKRNTDEKKSKQSRNSGEHKQDIIEGTKKKEEIEPTKSPIEDEAGEPWEEGYWD